MADPVDRVFVQALNTVKRIPRTGSTRPPVEDRLKLYGLYKQSMEGDVVRVMDRPVGEGDKLEAERQKWDAWNLQKGLSRTETKRKYITLLIETMRKYAASTQEARELVSELEFVWDQVQANAKLTPPSSSLSSTSSPFQAPLPSHPLPPPTPARTTTTANLDPPPMRTLAPSSHEDDTDLTGSNDDELFDDALENNPNSNPDAAKEPSPQPLQPPWHKRVETALANLTAETAALRERIEHHPSRPPLQPGRRTLSPTYFNDGGGRSPSSYYRRHQIGSSNSSGGGSAARRWSILLLSRTTLGLLRFLAKHLLVDALLFFLWSLFRWLTSRTSRRNVDFFWGWLWKGLSSLRR